MTDVDPNVPPVADPPVTDPAPGGGDDKDWKVEAEKWKVLSRKHEDRSKDLLKENTDLKNASMSDAEKAIEDARKEGESTTLKKVAERLVKAELKAIAAEKGAALPDIEALNLAKFANEDGEPDVEAIEKFVDSLGSSKNAFPSGKDLGIGRSGGSGVKQWSRADLSGKTHAEIVKAREAGHLDKLLGND